MNAGGRVAAAVAKPFGTLRDGRPVTRYVLRSGVARAVLIDYGATLASLRVPDRDGVLADVVLGFADPAGYERSRTFAGATVGRYANRIAGGRLRLNGRTYLLPCNDGPHHLHGGPDGFHRRLWRARPDPGGQAGVTFTLDSPDGDQGYPGHLAVEVRYRLTTGDDGWIRLRIGYTATNTEPVGGLATVVSLTNHAYLNLGGEGSGSVEDHVVHLRASRYLPVDETLIPLGAPADVAGTPMDFRAPARIGARLRSGHEQLLRARGYDHCWVLDDTPAVRRRPALRVEHPGSGRMLQVWTDRPGLHFYTANSFDGTEIGASGRAYRQTDAFAAETQAFPNAPNQPQFPTTVLAPGGTFRSTTELVLGVVD